MRGALLLSLLRDLLCAGRLHSGHLALHTLEFGAVATKLLSRKGAYFFGHSGSAISRIRMVAQKLRPAGAAACLQFLEELGHGVRIVAAVVQNVGADQIGLGFSLA